jgi:hypothetical protein
MSDKKSYVDVRIEVEEVRAALKKIIRSDFNNLIAEVIIDNLNETEVGISQLYLAMSGVRKLPRFKVLDEIYAEVPSLASWRMDKSRMETEKMLFQGKVKCKITDINLQRRDSYHVEYTFLDNKLGSTPIKDTYWLNEDKMKLSTDKEIIEGEDLPF